MNLILIVLLNESSSFPELEIKDIFKMLVQDLSPPSVV